MRTRPEKQIIDDLADLLADGEIDHESRLKAGHALKLSAAMLNEKTDPGQVMVTALRSMSPWLASGIAVTGSIASVVALLG